MPISRKKIGIESTIGLISIRRGKYYFTTSNLVLFLSPCPPGRLAIFESMILKIFRVVWFFSILGVLGFFLYTYAALPDPLVILDGEEQLAISKQTWFYAILALVAIFNM